MKRILGNKRILRAEFQTKGGHVYYYYHNLLKNGAKNKKKLMKKKQRERLRERELEGKRPQEIASAPAFLSAPNER